MANNVARLAFSLTNLASTSMSMKSEKVAEVSKVTSAILTLSASIAVTLPQVVAWQTHLQRHLLLQQSTAPEVTRKELLEAPISTDGLFGPRFHSMVDAMKSASEEAESICCHVGWPQPPSCDRPPSQHRDRRERWDPPPAASHPSAPPAPAAPHPKHYRPLCSHEG